MELGISRIYFEDDNLFFNKRLFELAPYLKRDGQHIVMLMEQI